MELHLQYNISLGQRKMLFNGHLFFKEKAMENTVYWRCESFSKSKCRARATTRNELIVKVSVDHNHVARAEEIGKQRILQEIKRQATSSRDSPSFIISTTTANINEVVGASLPTVRSMKRTICNIRQRLFLNPTSPTNVAELILPKQYKVTERGEPFLMFDSGLAADRILIFSTQRNIGVLRGAIHWYGDGTFKTVPHLFDQLYTIHGMDGRTSTPLIYALMTSRGHSSYITLLNALQQLWPDLQPQSLLSDYESAMIKAFQETYPQSNHRGCFFHFSQSIFRKVQMHGLKYRYETDVVFASKLRLLPALAFVPTSRVIECFEQVCEEFPEEAHPVMDYFEDTWIGRPNHRLGRRPPLFNISMWNCYQTVIDGLPKTNNGIEGWHRGFQCQLSAEHPNIWKFLDALKREQSLTDLKIDQYYSGQEPPAQRRKYRDSDKRLLRLVLSWNENTDIMQYLRGISHNITF